MLLQVPIKLDDRGVFGLNPRHIGVLGRGSEPLQRLAELPDVVLDALALRFVEAGEPGLIDPVCRRGKECLPPAGASDMALISADLGVYNVKLVLLQVMRLIAVILLFPSIFWMLAK